MQPLHHREHRLSRRASKNWTEFETRGDGDAVGGRIGSPARSLACVPYTHQGTAVLSTSTAERMQSTWGGSRVFELRPNALAIWPAKAMLVSVVGGVDWVEGDLRGVEVVAVPPAHRRAVEPLWQDTRAVRATMDTGDPPRELRFLGSRRRDHRIVVLTKADELLVAEQHAHVVPAARHAHRVPATRTRTHVHACGHTHTA